MNFQTLIMQKSYESAGIVTDNLPTAQSPITTSRYLPYFCTFSVRRQTTWRNRGRLKLVEFWGSFRPSAAHMDPAQTWRCSKSGSNLLENRIRMNVQTGRRGLPKNDESALGSV